MSIRSTSKGIVVDENRILLNKNYDERHGSYYTLPGGGQKMYEPLTETVRRECFEETGYTVIPVKMVAVCEEIILEEYIRRNYPEYSHRMYMIFLCKLDNVEKQDPVVTDYMQKGSVWINLEDTGTINIMPKKIEKNLSKILNGTAPLFLGTEKTQFHHA